MTLDAIANLNICMDSFDALLAELNDDQWKVQSYCPDWDVRGITSHLGGVETMLIGEEPGSWTDSVPFDKVSDYVASVQDLDNAGLLAAYRETIATRRAEMAGYTEDQMALPSMTPVGPQTYGRFMAIRVFDYWVHEQDIRGPLGMPGHESGAAAAMALNEIEISLPYIVGKKIGLPDGKTKSTGERAMSNHSMALPTSCSTRTRPLLPCSHVAGLTRKVQSTLAPSPGVATPTSAKKPPAPSASPCREVRIDSYPVNPVDSIRIYGPDPSDSASWVRSEARAGGAAGGGDQSLLSPCPANAGPSGAGRYCEP